MNSSLYLRTDLAIEENNVSTPHSGVQIQTLNKNKIHITTIDVHNDNGAKHLNRPIGRYITLEFPPVWQEDNQESAEEIQKSLTESLHMLLNTNKFPTRILVVGLGNRAITADAVGPLTADKIEVTGHYEKEKALLPYLPPCRLFAVSPGVMGKTGIETHKLIHAALKASNADLVIAIDSLAARSTSRLGQCIQLSNSGITPGSGIGNHRTALTAKTLDVPVIAIGTPLVVSSSTLVYDALEQAGIQKINSNLHSVLENGRSFFVTLNESDIATKLLSDIIANVINSVATHHNMDSK